MKQQMRISEEVQSILCCRLANKETKTTVELCCLNVGVCSTAQTIYTKLNQFVEKHGSDWMRYKAVATKEAAAMQCTTNGVAQKIKNISLDCVSTCFFFSGICRSQTEVVLKCLQKTSQFGNNAIFSHTKMSQNEEILENFKLFWKNDWNVSAKIYLGFNSLHD